MSTFQLIVGTAAILQVILLALVSNTLIDIKSRLGRPPS
jgi:hypothetical protein